MNWALLVVLACFLLTGFLLWSQHSFEQPITKQVYTSPIGPTREPPYYLTSSLTEQGAVNGNSIEG